MNELVPTHHLVPTLRVGMPVPTLPRRLAQALAVMSVALFWLLPFSPIIAVAALAATHRSTGWVRRTAVVGAVLSTGFTIAMAVVVVVLANSIPFVQ